MHMYGPLAPLGESKEYGLGASMSVLPSSADGLMAAMSPMVQKWLHGEQSYAYKAVVSDLNGVVRDWAESTVGVEIPSIDGMNLDKAQIWVYLSAAQKEVRRGNAFEASRYARAAALIDNHRLWRRLGVICLEDIGIANVPLLNVVLFLSGAKGVRQKLGEDKLLHMVMAALANSVKDRSACDIASTLESKSKRLSLLYGELMKLTSGKPDLLKEVMKNKSQPLMARVLAHQELVEPGLYHGKGSDKLIPPWAVYREMKLPGILMYPMIQYGFRYSDAQWMALPFLYELIAESALLGCKDAAALPPGEPIQGVCSYAYDMHVHKGKSAFAYFAKACKPVEAFFAARPGLDRQKCLGYAVFSAEGGELNCWLVYDRRDSMRVDTLMDEYESCKLSIKDAFVLVDLVASNLGLLNYARKKVMEPK